MKNPLVSFVVAGMLGAGTTGCLSSTSSDDSSTEEVVTSSAEEVSSSSEVTSDPAAAFRTTCEADGKIVKESSSCKGTNSCKGLNPDGTEHNCAGLSSCKGSLWCEENPAVTAYRTACEDDGKIVKESSSCKGTNSCKGLNPNGTEHDCAGLSECKGSLWCEEDPKTTFRTACEADGKVVKESSSCKGTNSCKGLNPDGTEHDCAGMSSCNGSLWCEEDPAVTAFRTACEDEGKVMKESSCQGLSGCKGLNPDRTEHDCAGQATCKGALWCEDVA